MRTGNDADDARMPLLAHEHVGAAIPERADLGLGLPRDPLLDGATLGVQRVELARDLGGALPVLGDEQLERGVGAANPAGGVQARGEPEAERAGVEVARVGAGDRDERPDPRLPARRQCLEALLDEPPVLTAERDEVGDRGERDEIEIVGRRRRSERLRELVGDARPAQLFARVAAHRRVDDRRVRQGAVEPWRMVVGDDDVEPERAGVIDLLDRRDPAVDGDQELGALRAEPLDRGRGEPVAVLEPARDEPPDVRAEGTERPDHDRGRADAVDVVVTVDDDPRAGGDVGTDLLERDVDPGERARIVALIARIEERTGLPGVGQSAAGEHLRKDVADPELTFEPQRRRELVRRDLQPRCQLGQRPWGRPTSGSASSRSAGGSGGSGVH